MKILSLCVVSLAACTACTEAPHANAPPAKPAGPPSDSGAMDGHIHPGPWTPADGGAPFVFALASDDRVRDSNIFRILPGKGGDKPTAAPVRLSNGKNAEFAITLTDSQRRTPVNPVTLLAVQDKEAPSTQRVYVVFKGDAHGAPPPCVGELVVRLDRIASGGEIVANGRVFTLPVVGSLEGTTLSLSPDRGTLVVNVPAPTGDSAQPMLLTYDIKPNSRTLDPANILMVPRGPA